LLLGYDSCFHVDRTGRAEGLALFWKNSLHCQPVNFSRNHITIEIVNNTLGNW